MCSALGVAVLWRMSHMFSVIVSIRRKYCVCCCLLLLERSSSTWVWKISVIPHTRFWPLLSTLINWEREKAKERIDKGENKPGKTDPRTWPDRISHFRPPLRPWLVPIGSSCVAGHLYSILFRRKAFRKPPIKAVKSREITASIQRDFACFW